MNLSHLSKSKINEFKSLQSKKMRDRLSLFIVEGGKCLIDMLPAYKLDSIVSTEDWYKKNHSILKQDCTVFIDNDHTGLERISTFGCPPEVIGIFKIPKPAKYKKKLDSSKLYLLLDEIQDPGNLGTIIRTCDWFGVYDIFASTNTVDIYNPKVIQSTMGSLSRVHVHYQDLCSLIEENEEMRVYGTLLAGKPLNECKTEEGGMIIMGNEGRGISPNLRNKITDAITIPPVNKASHPDSLNVSIATAITLSHFLLK